MNSLEKTIVSIFGFIFMGLTAYIASEISQIKQSQVAIVTVLEKHIEPSLQENKQKLEAVTKRLQLNEREIDALNYITSH